VYRNRRGSRVLGAIQLLAAGGMMGLKGGRGVNG
jgi:hypothetical protein